MKNEVSVVSLDRRFEKMERGIKDATRFFLEALEKDKTRLEIYLAGNEKMQSINRKFRDNDSPTNVLAFGVPEDFPGEGSGLSELGEVYLNPTYIKRHGEDINYMLLHGILHLSGFNHENKSDRIRMEKTEKKLIKWLSSRS